MSGPKVSITGQIQAGGWDAVNSTGRGPDAGFDQYLEHAAFEAGIFQDCFGTPAGQKCLDLLRNKTYRRRPNEQEIAIQSADVYAIAKAIREGQNAVVFMIEDACAFVTKKQGTSR